MSRGGAQEVFLSLFGTSECQRPNPEGLGLRVEETASLH